MVGPCIAYREGGRIRGAARLRGWTASAETAGLIWMHALAAGYSPDYLSENADGIRQDWPRAPLPATRRCPCYKPVFLTSA